MTARYNGVSATSQLYLGPADGRGEMYNSTSTKSPSDPPPLNSSVQPEELLEHQSGSLTPWQGHESTCGENRDFHKPYAFPRHSPRSAAAIGLIPVEVMPIELDIANFDDTQDRQGKMSRDGKDIPPNLAVCSRGLLRLKNAEKSTSVDALRIEPRNERIETGEIRR
jgi:hypothetical protein